MTASRPSVIPLTIAGLTLDLVSDPPTPSSFLPFRDIRRPPAPLSLTVATAADVFPPGLKTSQEKELSYWRQDDNESIALTGAQDVTLGCLTCNGAWSSARASLRQDCDQAAVLRILTEVFFRTVLIRQRRGLVLHASGISVGGRGLAFIGPSGRGKSTQARLWEERRGAVVVNDDRPAVTVEETGLRLHGTPWSGSSDKRAAHAVPLEALVFLEQADINSTHTLTRTEAISLLLPRAFLPYWSEAGMAEALTLADRLIRRARVVRLRCRPDASAVDCLEAGLGGPDLGAAT